MANDYNYGKMFLWQVCVPKAQHMWSTGTESEVSGKQAGSIRSVYVTGGLNLERYEF